MEDYPDCMRCDGTGWLEPIGPCSDGSYVTSRPCGNCDGTGKDIRRLNPVPDDWGALPGRFWPR